ncbi:MAG: hypothetical protein WAW36_00295 [Methylovulum miyakonense]|uniref:Imm32 family immunity protein n=1 Tax=Methylovulum miyakonense TaxID=645578 RepID=UPI003BB612EB
MKITLDIEYGKHGLPLIQPDAKAKLLAQKHGNEFTIKGNKEGLLFLAKSLASLAYMPELLENEGYHLHLDDLYSLNNQGIEFVLAIE